MSDEHVVLVAMRHPDGVTGGSEATSGTSVKVLIDSNCVFISKSSIAAFQLQRTFEKKNKQHDVLFHVQQHHNIFPADDI